MNVEERLRMLEVQTMNSNERMWELTRRITRIENVITDHVLAAPARASAGISVPESSNPDELYKRMSALASEFNGILPALAEAILVNGSTGHANVPPRNHSSSKTNDNLQGMHRNVEFQPPDRNHVLGPSSLSPNPSFFDPQINRPHAPTNLFSYMGHPGGPESCPWPPCVENGIGVEQVLAPMRGDPSDSQYYFCKEDHASGSTANTNPISDSQIELLDLHTLPPPVFPKDNNIDAKTEELVPSREGDSVDESLRVKEAVIYHHNPWGTDLNAISWEGTNNVIFDPSTDHHQHGDFNYKYETVQTKVSALVVSEKLGAPSHSAVKLPESSLPKTVLSYAGVTSKLPPAPIPSTSNATGSKKAINAERFFNDYMKRDTAQKPVRIDWIHKQLHQVTESQKAGIVRAISRFALKQATKSQLSGMGHLLDIMIGENIVSQDKVLKCFCDGVLSDLPTIFKESQHLFAEVVSRIASILVTTFNDTMKNLDWVVYLGSNLQSRQPQLCYGFCYKVLMVILERKKFQGALKLWHQTGSGKEILEEPALALSLK